MQIFPIVESVQRSQLASADGSRGFLHVCLCSGSNMHGLEGNDSAVYVEIAVAVLWQPRSDPVLSVASHMDQCEEAVLMTCDRCLLLFGLAVLQTLERKVG